MTILDKLDGENLLSVNGSVGLVDSNAVYMFSPPFFIAIDFHYYRCIAFKTQVFFNFIQIFLS